MQKITYNHPNRKPHNWLSYYHQDQSLSKYENKISGIVYDLGAGSAVYGDWCRRCASSYVSVDWPQSKHSGNIDIQADLNHPLPILDCVADSVICFSVIEHLYEPKILIKEVERILKPGGTLLIQVPWQWWIHEEPHDFYRFTPFMLEKILTDSGLSVKSLDAQGGIFTTLALKINYFSLRAIKGPRVVRSVLKCIAWTPWHVSQILALIFDKFDRHQYLEAHGYFVYATKECKGQVDCK